MVTLGFDRQCITPQLPQPLCGYEMNRVAVEVHDDLYTRVILMNQDGELFALVQCDLIAVDKFIIERVYDRVKDLGIKKEHITIVATHTHAGPGGVINTVEGLMGQMQGIFGKTNFELIDMIAEKIALAIHNASKDMLESDVIIARGKVENVGTERHDPTLPGDDSLLVFNFRRKDGREILLYNYACHPTVTGPGNIEMTADFPHAVERDMDYDMVMFVNSCCGDISSRFTRIDSSFEQCDIYAERIIKGIEEALEHPVYEGAFNDVFMNEYSVVVPIRKVRPVEEEQAKLAEYERQLEEAKKQNLSASELRVIASFAEGAKTAVNLAKALQGFTEEDVHYMMMRLQNVVIAVTPGEMFSTLGRPLKDEGIEVFGYGNGYYIYIADEYSYEKGYYEAMSSPFEKGVGELLSKEMKERGKELCQ